MPPLHHRRHRRPRPTPITRIAIGALVALWGPGAAMGALDPSACSAGGGVVGGTYLDSNLLCQPCPAGYGCPAGVAITHLTLASHMCRRGTYQPLSGHASCLVCPQDTACPLDGATAFTPCPATGSAPPNSTACLPCTHPDYYYRAADLQCLPRRRCTPGAQYETSRPAGADTTCADLTAYSPTPVSPTPTCVAGGRRLCHGVLASYIRVPETPTSDRALWAWSPCPAGSYLHTPLLADSSGRLLREQACRPYTDCAAQGMYRAVDGTISEVADNVCATATVCVAGEEYMVSGVVEALPDGTEGSDAVCRAYTACGPDEYVAVRGNATADHTCARRSSCLVPLNERFEASPAVDAPAGEPNSLGRDAVCRNYTACPPGFYENATGTRWVHITC